jgi:hypothetical protein
MFLKRSAIYLAFFFTAWVPVFGASKQDRDREEAIKIVKQIQRADYEGDRAALKSLHLQLAQFVVDKNIGGRVEYWRGFAMWRRAYNGFNDHVEMAELEADLQQAVEDFHDSAAKDPGLVDAKIGSLSCIGLIGYATGKKDPDRVKQLLAQIIDLRKEIEAVAPDNPRLLWVLGPMYWAMPPERGGSQAKAMELYDKGLDEIRKHKNKEDDPLTPSWGEPELLMNLAWSNLNRTTPDLDAAERDAQASLAIVPYWHYVRDILVPQIEAAKKEAQVAQDNK